MDNDDIKFGLMEPLEVAIIQTLQLLSEDIYRVLPLGRINEIITPIKKKNYYAAVSNGRCMGIIIYIKISKETAQACIKERREVKKDEQDDNGTELFLIAISGTPIMRLFKKFCKVNKGKLILFNKHTQKNGVQENKFGWIDIDGVAKF